MKQVNPLMTLCFVMVFLLAAAASCKKGDTGPAGPAGPAGAAGAAGATGAAGPKGDTGTANVIYSAWFDAKFTADIGSDGTTVVGYYFDTTITKLTTTILNTGEMKVYMNLSTAAAPVVVSLPYLEVGSGGALTITPYFQLGGMELYANADVSTAGTGAAKQFQYRYILIPGGKAARWAIDWNNYAEVKKYLNLKD
jgi:hypothetical protein